MASPGWELSATLVPWEIGADRFDIAGLTRDGTRCFAGYTGDFYGVWNVETGKLEWEDIDRELVDPLLADGSGPYLSLPKSSGVDAVRMFGPFGFGFPLTEHRGHRLRTLEPARSIDPKTHHLKSVPLVELAGPDGGVAVLELNDLSDDFAVPSFADEGATFVILQPYVVACYRLDRRYT